MVALLLQSSRKSFFQNLTKGFYWTANGPFDKPTAVFTIKTDVLRCFSFYAQLLSLALVMVLIIFSPTIRLLKFGSAQTSTSGHQSCKEKKNSE